jgi:DNA-binding Lrp family transcriptional regulator
LPIAYVLMNTEIGSEGDVVAALREIDGVQEVFNLWGVYDLIARVKTDSMDKLSHIINDKLQLSKIHTKLTVIVTES